MVILVGEILILVVLLANCAHTRQTPACSTPFAFVFAHQLDDSLTPCHACLSWTRQSTSYRRCSSRSPYSWWKRQPDQPLVQCEHSYRSRIFSLAFFIFVHTVGCQYCGRTFAGIETECWKSFAFGWIEPEHEFRSGGGCWSRA